MHDKNSMALVHLRIYCKEQLINYRMRNSRFSCIVMQCVHGCFNTNKLNSCKLVYTFIYKFSIWPWNIVKKRIERDVQIWEH